MKHLLLLLIFLPSLTFARVEIFQLVAFNWDAAGETLQLASLGSGTAIGNDLILTNKHVVQTGTNKFADLIVLCQAKVQAGKSVSCNMAAGVAAAHPSEDVALVRPIGSAFFPTVKRFHGTKRQGNSVRVHGFPSPTGQQGFGDKKTVQAFEAWLKDTTQPLLVEGDKLTVTRGEVLARLKSSNTGATYTQTDAKVNFGNSGGAVFDEYGDYLGIVTFKDNEDNSIFLEYHQIDDWVKTYGDRAPSYSKAAYSFYTSAISTKTKKTSLVRNTSLRDRILANKQKNKENSTVTTRTNRTYGRSSKTSQTLTPSQQRLYEYLLKKMAEKVQK